MSPNGKVTHLYYLLFLPQIGENVIENFVLRETAFWHIVPTIKKLFML